MTVEEAINTIKSLKQYYNECWEYGYVGFDNEDNKALDMAIRALEVVQGMEKVFWQELTVLDMRDATEEERNSLKRYIDSISKSTGVKFDFNSIKTELKPCEDCISRAEALRHRYFINDADGRCYSVVRVDEIIALPPVTPQQTYKIENSNFSEEQYEADLRNAYDCGYNCGYADAMIDIAESEEV